ncbi:MAG: hypothetical protein ACI8X5_003362 [Planctomycetota bacterium]
MVVLAVSNESDELVEQYIDKMGLSLRVAAGFSSGNDWGVKGYPSAVLINPEGEIVWSGHPGNLSSSKVKAALKGARPSKAGYLSFRSNEELAGELTSASKAAFDGKLGKALTEAKELAGNDKLDQEVRDQAQYLADGIEKHAMLLQKQAEGFIKNRYMMKGIGVLDSLGDAMEGTELGAELVTRLEEIENDEGLQGELTAEKSLAKAIEAADKRGMKKSAKKFEAVIKSYPGTQAAVRAKKMLRTKK